MILYKRVTGLVLSFLGDSMIVKVECTNKEEHQQNSAHDPQHRVIDVAQLVELRLSIRVIPLKTALNIIVRSRRLLTVKNSSSSINYTIIFSHLNIF